MAVLPTQQHTDTRDLSDPVYWLALDFFAQLAQIPLPVATANTSDPDFNEFIGIVEKSETVLLYIPLGMTTEQYIRELKWSLLHFIQGTEMDTEQFCTAIMNIGIGRDHGNNG